jgi:serine/threonine protein kinase KIN1/2
MSAAPVADSGSRGVHRSQSASARHTSQSSSSRAHAYRPSGDQAANLVNAARRDYEQSNLPQSGSRRSESRDRTANPQYPTRSDSLRNGPRSDRRYASIDATSNQQPPTNGMTADHPPTRSAAASNMPVVRKRTYVQCSTGTWSLGKTIGQGSMGKVKLAKNQETGEQVCLHQTHIPHF